MEQVAHMSMKELQVPDNCRILERFSHMHANCWSVNFERNGTESMRVQQQNTSLLGVREKRLQNCESIQENRQKELFLWINWYNTMCVSIQYSKSGYLKMLKADVLGVEAYLERGLRHSARRSLNPSSPARRSKATDALCFLFLFFFLSRESSDFLTHRRKCKINR